MRIITWSKWVWRWCNGICLRKYHFNLALNDSGITKPEKEIHCYLWREFSCCHYIKQGQDAKRHGSLNCCNDTTTQSPYRKRKLIEWSNSSSTTQCLNWNWIKKVFNYISIVLSLLANRKYICVRIKKEFDNSQFLSKISTCSWTSTT